jgi:hypothetical protein
MAIERDENDDDHDLDQPTRVMPIYSAYKKPMELFETRDFVKICAPMVRYSK